MRQGTWLSAVTLAKAFPGVEVVVKQQKEGASGDLVTLGGVKTHGTPRGDSVSALTIASLARNTLQTCLWVPSSDATLRHLHTRTRENR